MTGNDNPGRAGGETSRRLYVYNGGFLTQGRVRRILDLAGYDIRLGAPGAGDMVGVWGKSPTSPRGEAVAARRDVPVLRVEDAWLRSLFPGREGAPPLGLVLDRTGVHFDGAAPSDLETLLREDPLDDTALLDRAREGIERIKTGHLTKYTGFDPAAPVPEPGYVLVIDQTRGDASVTGSGADANSFREMLYWAQEDFLGARVVIKTHPETALGHREGYFGPEDATETVTLLTEPVSPWALFEGAMAVYTVSSQMGFEAIFAGHKPVVFGTPFFAGWGLTDDRREVRRRGRNLTRAQLFAGAMIRYPVWYDPCRDTLCAFETALDAFEAETRCWREDHLGWIATGMRLWKRGALQEFFGRHAPVRFDEDAQRADDLALETGARRMTWASKAAPGESAIRVEDGFLRSRGLGAELIPPLSLVCDDLGIYYDPTRPSRLEKLISGSETLRPGQRLRAERLIRRLCDLGLSKYNLGGALPDLPPGHRILVPGQVEDDASILTGGGLVRTNLDLLRAARSANPDAVILYKPHPDVEAGLRSGAVPPDALQDLADMVLPGADPAALLKEVQEVWTMTSLLGFEALLRGVPVTTLGAPFYAGWGLTTDRGPIPLRRRARPDLAGLAHAALIDHPRYHDPVSSLPCPPEVVLDRLAAGDIPQPTRANRVLSKLQGLLASYASLWRR